MQLQPELKNLLDHFDTQGEKYVEGGRNTIKLFNYQNQKINVKSFKIPN